MKTLTHKILFLVFLCLLVSFTSSASYSSEQFFPRIGFYDVYTDTSLSMAERVSYWGQVDSAGLNVIVTFADDSSTRNDYGLKCIGQDTNLTVMDQYGIPKRIAQFAQYGYDAHFEAEQTYYDSTKGYRFRFTTGTNVEDPTAFGGAARIAVVGTDSLGYLISGLDSVKQKTSPFFGSISFEFHFRLKVADNSSSDPVCLIEEFAAPVSEEFVLKDADTILASDFQSPDSYQSFALDTFYVGKSWKLSCRVYWFGNEDLWVDQIRCLNNVAKYALTLNPDSIRSGFTQWYERIDTANFYRFYPEDEPVPLKYEMHRWFDNYATSVLPGRPGCAVLETYPAHVWPYIPDTQRPELFQNYYPLAATVDSASQGANSLQTALNGFIEGIIPTATAAKTQNVDFWFVVQAHAESSASRHLRSPQASEISAQVWLALAYGAKGIGYYRYTPSETETSWDAGLVSWDDSEQRYKPNYRWHAVKDINARIDSIGETLLNLNWQGAGVCYDVANVLGSFLDSMKSAEFDSAWIEAGFFKDDADANYFMLVNRRCLSTEEQNVTVHIDSTAMESSKKMWYVIDQYSQDTTLTGAIDGTIPFTTLLEPGEGKLFKLVPLPDSAFHGTAHPHTWQGGIMIDGEF